MKPEAGQAVTATTPPSAEPFLHVMEVERSALDRVSDGLHRIYRGALDVLLVHGVFAEPAMRAVVDAVHADRDGFALMPQEHPDLQQQQIVFYGDAMSHNSVENLGPPMERYLTNASRWRTACRRLFAGGRDYEAQLVEILGAVAGGRAVDVPSYNDGRSYCPSTIRMIPPGHAAPFHIDNYFQGVQGWDYLSATVDIAHPVNFFTMLSPAESGGDLEIYELRFNDPRAPLDGSTQKDHTRFAHHTFRMGPGDLIFFASSRFWHRVSEVRGARPRWTIGGFLGFALDDQTVFYWG